jgi:phosphoribosylglycinamide formyltransferase-1
MDKDFPHGKLVWFKPEERNFDLSLNKKPVRFLVLVSGGGTNLQALIDAEKSGKLSGGTIAAVISDRAGVFAIERAERAGIPIFVETPKKELSWAERNLELSNRMLEKARSLKIDAIILAGFLSILQGNIVSEYSGKMINLHPSLLPKFGGNGMYGMKVHQAVLDAGEKESGCTVHFVDAGTDTGKIILQRKVPVLPEDSAEDLAKRIHREEHIAIVDAAVVLVNSNL